METQTIEGTWEEILQHSPELSGQRVRVTILSSTLKPPLKLDELLRDRIGVVSFQPDDLSDRTHAAYSEALQLKYKNLNR